MDSSLGMILYSALIFIIEDQPLLFCFWCMNFFSFFIRFFSLFMKVFYLRTEIGKEGRGKVATAVGQRFFSTYPSILRLYTNQAFFAMKGGCIYPSCSTKHNHAHACVL